MTFELYYTSAISGLRPGASGFCTVAMTAGLPAALAMRLESLSSYRFVFDAGSARAARNPVQWAHWRVPSASGGAQADVLSRIGFCGFDHTGRPNHLAHHLVLDNVSAQLAGPTWLMRQRGVLASAWSGEPCILPPRKMLPAGTAEPRPCAAWERATGDAGWAGVVAAGFLVKAAAGEMVAPTYIIVDLAADTAEADALAMMDEAIALLPPRYRWQVTFNTHFTELPAGLTCAWRVVAAGTPAAVAARRSRTAGMLLDLTQSRGAAPADEAADAGRLGRLLTVPIRPALRPAAPSEQSDRRDDAHRAERTARQQPQQQQEGA